MYLLIHAELRDQDGDRIASRLSQLCGGGQEVHKKY
jgi:hypothetical protein